MDGTPDLIRSEPLRTAAGRGMRSRWVVPPDPQGWAGFALSEWELRSARWRDRHEHTETNVVLEGELHVESGGQTVVARPGDTVTVPAGATGTYWAPGHARMLAVYGPHPEPVGPQPGSYADLPEEG